MIPRTAPPSNRLGSKEDIGTTLPVHASNERRPSSLMAVVGADCLPIEVFKDPPTSVTIARSRAIEARWLCNANNRSGRSAIFMSKHGALGILIVKMATAAPVTLGSGPGNLVQVPLAATSLRAAGQSEEV